MPIFLYYQLDRWSNQMRILCNCEILYYTSKSGLIMGHKCTYSVINYHCFGNYGYYWKFKSYEVMHFKYLFYILYVIEIYRKI